MDNDVTFYDPSTGDKIGAIKPPRDEKDNFIYPVESLAFSADGKTLAVGAGRSIRLWDTALRKEIRLLPQQKGGILVLAWTTDGKTLACSTTNGALVFWDVTDNKERANLTGNWGVVCFLAFTSRDDRLLTSSTDNNLRVWHVASGKEVANTGGLGRLTGSEQVHAYSGAKKLRAMPRKQVGQAQKYKNQAFDDQADFSGWTGTREALFHIVLQGET